MAFIVPPAPGVRKVADLAVLDLIVIQMTFALSSSTYACPLCHHVVITHKVTSYQYRVGGLEPVLVL